MKRVSNLDVHVMLNDRCLMPSVLQTFELLQGCKNVVIKQAPSLPTAHRPETKLLALGPHHICHFFTSLPYFPWIHKRHIRIRPYFPGQMITYLLATAAQRIPSSIPSPGVRKIIYSASYHALFHAWLATSNMAELPTGNGRLKHSSSCWVKIQFRTVSV